VQSVATNDPAFADREPFKELLPEYVVPLQFSLVLLGCLADRSPLQSCLTLEGLLSHL
jgi:hypothetical protein